MVGIVSPSADLYTSWKIAESSSSGKNEIGEVMEVCFSDLVTVVVTNTNGYATFLACSSLSSREVYQNYTIRIFLKVFIF